MRLFGRSHKHAEQHQMVDALGAKGYRMTPQRLMIVAAVEDSNDHISAEEVYSKVLEKLKLNNNYPYILQIKLKWDAHQNNLFLKSYLFQVYHQQQ